MQTTGSGKQSIALLFRVPQERCFSMPRKDETRRRSRTCPAGDVGDVNKLWLTSTISWHVRMKIFSQAEAPTACYIHIRAYLLGTRDSTCLVSNHRVRTTRSAALRLFGIVAQTPCKAHGQAYCKKHLVLFRQLHVNPNSSFCIKL